MLHLYLGEAVSSGEACKELVRRSLESSRLPYLTVTPTFSTRPVHGYLSGEHFTCWRCALEFPEAEPQACEVWTRVMGYFRPVSSFNIGKTGEYHDRTAITEAAADLVPQADEAAPAAAELQIAGLVGYPPATGPGSSPRQFSQGCPGNARTATIPPSSTPASRERSRGRRWRRSWTSARLLDGVVFSGGEPTRQLALIDAIRRVRSAGYGVGLHTGGAYPTRLAAILPLVDWVGLDIKAMPDQFDAITRTRGGALPAFRSLDLVLESGVDVQVRTTVDPTVMGEDDVARLTVHLAERGVGEHVIQTVRAEGPPDTEALARLGAGRLIGKCQSDARENRRRRGVAPPVLEC